MFQPAPECGKTATLGVFLAGFLGCAANSFFGVSRAQTDSKNPVPRKNQAALRLWFSGVTLNALEQARWDMPLGRSGSSIQRTDFIENHTAFWSKKMMFKLITGLCCTLLLVDSWNQTLEKSGQLITRFIH